MPEGDTIFRAARTLRLALAGQVVEEFESVFPRLSRVDHDHPLRGQTVEDVKSAGKHLLMHFSGGFCLRTHMLMNGTWHIYRRAERWRRPRSEMRVVIATAEYVAVAFNIQVAEFLDEKSMRRSGAIRDLGPDLLSPTFDPETALQSLRNAGDKSLAEALLNQRRIAGIGNVYKSEVLFVARMNPFRNVASFTDEELSLVIRTAKKLLEANVKESSDSGIVTYTGFRRTTGRSDPSARLWVYGRRGQPCRRCGTAIEYLKQGLDARSTYWCPNCQPAEEPGSP